MREKNYVVEAYDKDNDMYSVIAETDDIEKAREIGEAVGTDIKAGTYNLNIEAAPPEPFDWVTLTDRKAEKSFFFDGEDRTWKLQTA